MPRIASLEALQRAAAGFEVTDLTLVIEPSAGAAARRSLDHCGLLLLGETRGVRENPLIIRALMQAFGLRSLALEWPGELAEVIGAFAAGGMLADHPLLWLGDGRITAGHLAVLRERARAGQLDLALTGGTAGADGNRILAGATAESGTLAVAGGARPAAVSGVRDIRISYGRGGYYDMRPSQIHPSISIWPSQVRLYQEDGSLILELPIATEAIVPHRPSPWPQLPDVHATEPDKEPEVRRRIEQALSGQVPLPDGIPARWQVRASSPGNVSAAEAELAERLIRS